MVQNHNQVRLALDHHGEIGMRDEQLVANPQHGAAHIVHAHDHLRSRLQLARNLRQHVAGFHNVFDLFRRWMTRQQNCGVHFPKDIPGFIEVFPIGIFLDKSDKRITRFGEFSILAQLNGRLKIRQTDVHRGQRSDFPALLLFHFDFFFDEGVVTEPGSPAEDRQCQQ